MQLIDTILIFVAGVACGAFLIILVAGFFNDDDFPPP
jgi:hypothetical protein